MKISTKGRYGLRAMIDLAINSSEGCTSLADISHRQDLSLNYLESIFSYLKRAGLVVGIAGAQGGYMLAKPADEITLYEIMTVLEGSMSVYDSFGEETKIRSFLNRNVWDVIDKNVNEVLTGTTLADVLKNMETSRLSGDCSGL
ncbi:RrF2 family transcriptional regulator [Caproiciproducens galactitolivorans]|uniref:Rrf2 family transcriptional regulator n=1 Tax=Caproiciproducens galactitolivorans TaxID=642589 RepID=A0ABT4BPG5_9FIRM|nr:Rrf2 family transcriptional regulator [Caproiciproducens galactitolivorans]MCY1712776.1 Rrf2 family transcriptional regulator [Caproiciproducens galactitolivorans]